MTLGSPHAPTVTVYSNMPRQHPLLLLAACTVVALATAAAAEVAAASAPPDLLPDHVYTTIEPNSNDTSVVAPNTAVQGVALGPAFSGVPQPAACGALCRAEAGRCVWFEYCGAQVRAGGRAGWHLTAAAAVCVDEAGGGAHSASVYPVCPQPKPVSHTTCLAEPVPSPILAPASADWLPPGRFGTATGLPAVPPAAANCSVQPIVKTRGFPLQVASGAALLMACSNARAPVC